MSRVVHPDFEHGQRYVPPRPNFCAEPSPAISWSSCSSSSAHHSCCGAVCRSGGYHAYEAAQPSGWLESFRIEIIDGDSIRSGGRCLSPGRLQHAGRRRQCQMRARARFVASSDSASGSSSPAASSIFGGSLAPVRAAPRARDNAITAGYCATLSVRGQDVGTTLIGEGLAEPYVCTKTSCPPRKDWCCVLKPCGNRGREVAFPTRPQAVRLEPPMASILDKCAGVPRKDFAPGTVLLSEGETSGRLYILAEGSVEVLRGDTQVAVIGDAGSVFGEMSVLLNRPHTATVRARSPVVRVRVRRRRELPQVKSRDRVSARQAARRAPQRRDHLSRRLEAAIRRARQSSRHGGRGAGELDSPAARGVHAGS